MYGILLSVLFFALPVASVVFFLVSLVAYLRARSANRRQSGTYSAAQLKTRLVLLVVSAIVAGVLVACVVGIVALLYMAVAFM